MRSRDHITRRSFLATLGATAASLACAPTVNARMGVRRLRRVGVQLYSLRDDARRDLSRTLGHEQMIVASLPIRGTPTLDDYRRWADRLNVAARQARTRDMWIGFHNHATDFKLVDGAVPYDLLMDRTDPSLLHHQLDTGNLAMAGRDPLDYLKRYNSRYWSFHIKDVPRLGADHDVELGTGVIDFKRLLASVDDIDRKHFFVEQETYPGTPLESVRKDYTYLSRLEF